MECRTIKAIHQWERRPDKPYLKDGILISDVAESLHIRVEQLAFVLNRSMSLSFNMWIDHLRVAEGRRLIKSNPQISISEAARLSGFSGSMTFVRAFKNIAGESPQSFKRFLNRTGTKKASIFFW